MGDMAVGMIRRWCSHICLQCLTEDRCLVDRLQEVGIKVNSRKVLGAVLRNAGVPAWSPA